MRKLLISPLVIILIFAAAATGYEAYAASQQTYQITMEDENVTEVIIPPNGEEIVYNHYEVHDGETATATVMVILTIDENGNIVR